MANCNLPHHHHPPAFIEQLPTEQDFATIAELFHQLADSSRLRLFWILCHTEECVINLSAMMEMSSPALSHHLKQLKACGLIVSRRAGKEVYYRAASTLTAQNLHQMTEKMSHLVCPQAPQQPDLPPPKPEQMEAIHRQLTQDLRQRITIEELARQHYLDSSTLKREFKRIYGLPIATYIKEYRIKKAMELLIHTSLSISHIAAAVGYETPSKFTAAFRSTTQLTPTDYRKRNRKN